jgi:hypothetical protein
MVPMPSVVLVKLTNVYGILAKNVFVDCRFGTCIMQDGDFTTFSYSVVWAAAERMREEKYRVRCPFARLNKWFIQKTVDATLLERDILASEQRYKDTNEGRTSPISDGSTTPPPSEHASLSDRDEKVQVVIPEGQYICLVPTKHNPVFGIVAENVTEKMSSGRCIMAKALPSEPSEIKTLPMERLQKGVNRMNLKVYKRLCPCEHLDDLLAADKVDYVEQSTEMVDANNSPPADTADTDMVDANNSPPADTAEKVDAGILLEDGTYVCFIQKQSRPRFGVLMRDVTEDEKCGTCLLADPTFESYTYQDFSLDVLQRAADRFDQEAYGTQARVILEM